MSSGAMKSKIETLLICSEIDPECSRSVGAVEGAGGNPRVGTDLITAMKNVTFEGVSGFVKLDANGDRSNNFGVPQVPPVYFILS